MIYNFDPLTFQIFFVDRFVHKGGLYEVEPRAYAALSFRVRGTGEFQIADKHFITKTGDVLFMPANTPYRVEYSDSVSISVNLNDCNYDEAENISLKNSAAIELRFQRMLELWNERHSVNQVKSSIYDILETIANDKQLALGETAFANSIRYIDEHFRDPELDIEAVCKNGFISVSSLQRAFRENMGMSPKQYLIKLRMNKALELLTENDISIKEVSFACGFADEKYFSRAFKKKYGYPPSQIRNHIII